MVTAPSSYYALSLHDALPIYLWYHPKALPVAAQRLAQILSQKDPQHKHYYQKQARKYIRSLAPLEQQITQIKQHHHNKLVAVSEPVFDYSLQQMGFEIANKNFAHAIEEGSDPSPQDIKQLQQLIRSEERRVGKECRSRGAQCR